MGLVGEEQYGLETVMEVEDDCGWKRLWGGDENFFSAARRTRADRAERWIDLRILKIGFMRHGGMKVESGVGSGQRSVSR